MEELSNEALFESALSDEPIAETVTTEPVVAGDTRARDEQGRFVEKTEVVETKPEVQEKPVEQAQVEPVGVRQLREALERQQRRADELERRFIASQPKAEPVAKPDVFENPEGAIKAGAQELVAPLEQKFSSFIETVSRRDAVREHGQDTVTEAYKALDQAANSGDPKAIATVQAVKQSMDPYGDIVGWYRETEPSRDPQAFFQKQLAESLKDEKFRSELVSKLNPPSEEKPKPVFNIPPSLGRAAAAAASVSDGKDLSNESIFASALR